MNTELHVDAEHIAHFLSRYLKDAGIVDPDEGCVLPHTYTTAFFAWLCALLYMENLGDEWLDHAVRAVDAELGFIADWRRHPLPGGSEPEFHWEMKNLALVNVEQLIGDRLPKALNVRLREALLNWRNLNIDSANWTAMRAVAYRMRYICFGHKVDRCRSQLELSLLLAMQTPEGFFPDTPNSHTMQYHAYVLSLLALYHRLTGSACVCDAFLQGVRFVADFVDPAGDFNYYGRGQRQLKGYACLILALTEAADLCDDPDEKGRYYALRQRVYQFVCEHRRPDGVFPLVLNHSNGRWGWYAYNHLGDYLALCAVWFLLTAQRVEQSADESCLQEVYTRCYPGVGLAVAARPGWFAAFSTGGEDLSEPAGVVHLWPTGPSCLGGPEQARAMGIDYTKNYIGLLVDGHPLLQRLRGKMSADSTAIRFSFSSPNMKVEQIYHLGGGLSLEQILTPKRSQSSVTPLVIAGKSPPCCSLPLQLEGTCASPIGLVPRFLSKAHWLVTLMVTHTEFTVSKVPPQQAQIYIFRARPSVIQALWRIVLKAIWVIWVKWERRLYYKRAQISC